MIRRFSILFITVLLVAASTHAAQVRIELKGAAVVQPGEMKLGDIASIASDDADAAAVAMGVSLGVTPLPGNARIVTRENVTMYLARSGITPSSVAWSGDSACTITIQSQRVTGSQIVDAARMYLMSHPLLQQDGIQIDVLQTPRDQVVAGESTPELIVSPASITQPWGQLRVYVRVMSGARVLNTLPVLFRITSNQKVLYAARQIPRGETITETDLELRDITIGATDGVESYMVDPSLVVGKKTLRIVNAGTPITDAIITEPFAIRRGEFVSLYVTTDHMEIITKGVAQRDARVGEIVPVKATVSGKEITCRVSGNGQVEMAL